MKITPSISDKGWIKDTPTRIRNMFGHMVACKIEQTGMLNDKALSLQTIFGNYQDNPDELLIQLQDKLTVYFTECFKSSTVICTLEDDNEARYTVNLFCKIIDENDVEHNLAVVLINTVDDQLKYLIKGE